MTIACIYDMDNTFALTSEADKAALNQTFSHVIADHRLDIDFEKELRGKDIGVVCRVLNERGNLSLDEHTVRMNFRRNFNHHAEKIRFTPGTPAALEKLSAAGVIQSIASNSSHARIHSVLDQLNILAMADIRSHLRGGVFSALDDFTPSRLKPLPDVFVLAAQNILQGFTNSNFKIYMIDESPTGLKSAIAAKAHFQDHYGVLVDVIGYTGDRHMTGGSPKQAEAELMALGADICFDDMSAMADYVIGTGLPSPDVFARLPLEKERAPTPNIF